MNHRPEDGGSTHHVSVIDGHHEVILNVIQHYKKYWLLVAVNVGIVQSVPSTADIFCFTAHPHPSSYNS
jgi:hypothetical protein